MRIGRVRASLAMLAIVVGSLGMLSGVSSAGETGGGGSVDACVREGRDYLAPKFEGYSSSCKAGFERVSLATGFDVPACIGNDKPIYSPVGETCKGGYQYVELDTTNYGGLPACVQPGKNIFFPREGDGCPENFEFVRFTEAQTSY